MAIDFKRESEIFHTIIDTMLDTFQMPYSGKCCENDKVRSDFLSWEESYGEQSINGFYNDNGELVSPGHRGYEKVLPIKEQILQEMRKWLPKEESKTVANNITKIVMDTIDECKKFYRFDREESSFRITASLGASPTSNPESVKKYWKEKTGEDIQIEERNPKLFWYIDEGYTDEDLEYEFDDPNWKENLDKEWKDELEKRAQKHNENLKKLESLKVNEK